VLVNENVFSVEVRTECVDLYKALSASFVTN